jgi:hypothetical protein
MPRPTNKNDLLALSAKNFFTLNALVDDMPPEELDREFKPGSMNRNVRDVLAHLHHWHLLLLEWYGLGMCGGRPEMPAKGYSWAATPDLNRAIHARYAKTSLKTVRRLFGRSHAEVQALIARHSDVELFAKKRYPWTGSTSLGAYLVSATSSHYEWAMKLIKRAKP